MTTVAQPKSHFLTVNARPWWCGAPRATLMEPSALSALERFLRA